jgi:arylsulfatase A-like enzyme
LLIIKLTKHIMSKIKLATTALGLAAITSIYSQDKPNVVFILTDDLGYGDLSCYGQDKFQTPNIDRLALTGTRFTRSYSGTTVSAPSRASLLTGLHTGNAPIRGNREIQPEGQAPLPADTYTLFKLFKESGYITGVFGKWGLGYPGSTGDPVNQYVDHFLDTIVSDWHTTTIRVTSGKMIPKFIYLITTMEDLAPILKT